MLVLGLLLPHSLRYALTLKRLTTKILQYFYQVVGQLQQNNPVLAGYTVNKEGIHLGIGFNRCLQQFPADIGNFGVFLGPNEIIQRAAAKQVHFAKDFTGPHRIQQSFTALKTENAFGDLAADNDAEAGTGQFTVNRLLFLIMADYAAVRQLIQKVVPHGNLLFFIKYILIHAHPSFNCSIRDQRGAFLLSF